MGQRKKGEVKFTCPVSQNHDRTVETIVRPCKKFSGTSVIPERSFVGHESFSRLGNGIRNCFCNCFNDLRIHRLDGGCKRIKSLMTNVFVQFSIKLRRIVQNDVLWVICRAFDGIIDSTLLNSLSIQIQRFALGSIAPRTCDNYSVKSEGFGGRFESGGSYKITVDRSWAVSNF